MQKTEFSKIIEMKIIVKSSLKKSIFHMWQMLPGNSVSYISLGDPQVGFLHHSHNSTETPYILIITNLINMVNGNWNV